MSDQAENRQNDDPSQAPQQDFSFPFQIPSALQHPGNVLLLTSVPLLAGAFVGYKLPTLRSVQDMVGGEKSAKAKPTDAAALAAELHPDQVRALASRTAVRAFRIATFGTVATFGVLGAAAFYASGHESMDEAVRGTRTWATSLRTSLEAFFGTAERRERQLAQHPDVVATKHMTEEQEMNYLYNKYMAASSSSAEDEEKDDGKSAKSDGNRTTKQ